MIFGVYLLPVIACILLHFGFEYRGEWYVYLWLCLFGEATAAGAHYFFYRQHTYVTEYLGSIVKSIHYEEDWVELVETTETRTDGNGHSYQVKKIREKYHPEKYYFFSSLDTKFKCDYLFYSYVKNLWRISGYTDSWSGSSIKGGRRYGKSYRFNDFPPAEEQNIDNWVPVTETHKYKNKIRCSNSILKHERIDEQQAMDMGLVDYPEIIDFDAPCIISRDRTVPEEIDRYFRKFNARIAPKSEMRLYIILFDESRGIGITEHQKNYWQGGNKNEFVLCIGLNYRNNVKWARAFSWADEQQKEVDVAQWVINQGTLNWEKLFNYLSSHLSDWKRKEFSDFNYINVTLPLWHTLGVYGISAAENALAICIALK